MHMMKIILKMWNSVRDLSRGEDQANLRVREHVKETLKQYKDTINFFEKLDRGEVQIPPNVTKHPNLESYIKSLQT
jgi:hypothetical protein